MAASKRPTRLLLVLVGVVVLACVVLGLFFGYQYLRRGQDYTGRPLVLIYSPTSGERVALGHGVPMLAMARSHSGITRMELWAEGKIVASQEAPDGETLSPMTLAAAWIPTTLGQHTIAARAFTARGLAGYASVNVEVIAEEAALGSHTVAEGESLDSIAADYGVGAAELAGLNPDLPATGPAVGSELIVPLDILPSNEPPTPEESAESAPDTTAALAPGSLLGGAVELSGLTSLRLEALKLETRAGYETLHCYASLGDRQPGWYPDADGDPATDESFARLSETAWDIAAHFSGGAAPIIFWPGEADLPFNITCVGVRLGGSDAVELGSLALAIPPAGWDGERRRASAEGEGGFVLEYTVGPADREPKGLDSGMAVPQNLRYDDRRQSLRWDYTPNTEPAAEPEIDGFLVFLNDNLVFEVGVDERESRLPEEWLAPPCGETYDFTLRAFHRPYPDGAYSDASSTVTIAGGEPGTEACNREFLVALRRLIVYDMGNDGDGDPRGMGPINGFASANGALHSFGNPPSVSIFNDSNFNLDTFFWDDYSEANVFLVPLVEGDDLQIGFHMADHDRRGWYDNAICTGGQTLRASDLLSGPVEGSFDATRNWEDEVRCRIEYTIEPAPGSPVGVAGGGMLLPWLDLTGVTLDEATSELQLHVRNTGTAAWANHDLEVRVTNRDGEEVGTHTWPLFYLDALGPEVVLQDASLTAESAQAVCVLLDPNDRVLESLESTGTLHHGPECPSLPDLTIEGVEYEGNDSRLQVTVRNIGDGTVEDQVVSVDLLSPDGSAITTPLRPAVALLEHAQSMVITWPSIDPDVRQAMLEGYTVRLNADGRLLEDDPTNNDYTVPAGQRIWAHFSRSWVTAFFQDWRFGYPTHHFVVSFSASVVGGGSSQPIGNWSQDFDWQPETDDEWGGEYCNECKTPQVTLGGDERLVIGAAASVRKAGSATRHGLGSFATTIDVRDPTHTYPMFYGEGVCGETLPTGSYWPMVDVTDVGDYYLPRQWGVTYCVLRERER